MSAATEAHAEALRERSFTALPGLVGPERVARLRAALLALHRRLGEPPLYAREPVLLGQDLEISGTGLVVHKLLRFAPTLLVDLVEPAAIEILRRVLGDAMQLEFVGAVLADHTRPFFRWHNHVGGIDDEVFRRRGLRPPIAGPERVAMLVYLDEMGPESGQLLVWPHRLGGAEAPPHPIDMMSWPGQVAVCGPAGTVVLLDQCTWHAVLPRTRGEGPRAFVGLWFAAADAPASQRVDESLRALETADPLLRSLLPGGRRG